MGFRDRIAWQEAKRNMHICLILSENDMQTIRSQNYSDLPSSIIEILRAASSSPHVRKISYAYIDEPNRKILSPHRKLASLLARALKGSIIRLAFLVDKIDCLINKYDLRKREICPTDRQSLLEKNGEVFLLNQKRESFFSFTTFEDSEAAKNQQFDLLVRGSGLGIEKGEILNSYSSLGLLSLHHGNNILNRGGPVGFWEVYFGEESGITAQILTPELDGGKVVYRGRLETIPNPAANCANIYRHTSAVLQTAFSIIASRSYSSDSSTLRTIEEFEVYTRSILKQPSLALRITVSANLLLRSLTTLISTRIPRFFMSRYCNPYEKWGISLTSDFNKRLDSWIRIFPLDCDESSDNWVADPFFVTVSGIDYLLYEYYIFGKRKGVIGYSKLDHSLRRAKRELKIASSGILLENKFHLSYPCTFNIKNESYFVPENNENGANLYRISKGDGDALRSVFVRNLLDGYCIDPTYIRLNGYDYLFVTRMHETGATLHLFYCRDITKDKLITHPSSPLCVDHSLGRSAGRILVDSEDQNIIIRPSQIMKTGYGEGILFARYKLDENQCRLLGVQKKIKPPRKSLYSNLHHIDYLRDITVIDYIKRKS